jgi:hypothetical protein
MGSVESQSRRVDVARPGGIWKVVETSQPAPGPCVVDR